MRFEIQNPINSKENKCVICKFPLKLEPTNYLTPDNEMTFGDFIIRFEDKFLRNIYTIEQIESSDQINNLKIFYEIFNSYIAICIRLLALLNQNRLDFLNDATEEFVQETFLGDEICDIKNTINQTDIKNAIKKSGSVNKFNLKVYAYLYYQLVAFPKSEINYESITSSKFFIHVHELIKGKVHLHHSHITGQIIGYSHDFCNTKVTEKSNAEIRLIAHNFFSFDLFYFLKTYVASARCSKEVNVGGNGLTQANYGRINNEIILIDSLKYYQKSLSQLCSTMAIQEKMNVKKLAEKFLTEHHYISTIW